MRLQAHDEQQVDNFNNAVRVSDGDRSACRGLGEEFRVFDRQFSSIRQMNVEWLKWMCLMQVPQLPDCHSNIVARAVGPFKINSRQSRRLAALRQPFPGRPRNLLCRNAASAAMSGNSSDRRDGRSILLCITVSTTIVFSR